MSIAGAMVDPGTLGAVGKGRWLDVEAFDIRWLGANLEFTFTTNKVGTQQTPEIVW